MAELVNRQIRAEVHVGRDTRLGRKEWAGHSLATALGLSALPCDVGPAVTREAGMPPAWGCPAVSSSEHTPVKGMRAWVTHAAGLGPEVVGGRGCGEGFF